MDWSLNENETLSNTTVSDHILENRAVFYLKWAHDVVVYIIAYSAMFAMGCDISLAKVRTHLRHPQPAIVGLIGQYVVMPLSGFLTIKSLKVDSLNAAGILILCCSPGGGYSNLIAYLTDCDVPLSVCMTTLSSFLSLGLTPVNLWLYGRTVAATDIVMPYTKILIALAILKSVLIAGMIFRWRFPSKASTVTKIGVSMSTTMLFIRQLIVLLIHPTYYMELSWKLYAGVFIIPFIGLCIPYLTALALREPSRIAKTLALECAIQSLGTAFTIALVSFPAKVLWDVQKYIALYSDVTVSGFLTVALMYRFIKWTYSEKPKAISTDWPVEDETEHL